MGVSVSVGLPGPFFYSKPLRQRSRRPRPGVTAGIIGLMIWLLLLPIHLTVAMIRIGAALIRLLQPRR